MKDIQLNYIGQVDMGDIGRRVFNLSDLLTPEEMKAGQQVELSVELVTENTNGALAARVKLVKIPKELFAREDGTYGWYDETWNEGDDVHYRTLDEAATAQKNYCDNVL